MRLFRCFVVFLEKNKVIGYPFRDRQFVIRFLLKMRGVSLGEEKICHRGLARGIRGRRYERARDGAGARWGGRRGGAGGAVGRAARWGGRRGGAGARWGGRAMGRARDGTLHASSRRPTSSECGDRKRPYKSLSQASSRHEAPLHFVGRSSILLASTKRPYRMRVGEKGCTGNLVKGASGKEPLASRCILYRLMLQSLTNVNHSTILSRFTSFFCVSFGD